MVDSGAFDARSVQRQLCQSHSRLREILSRTGGPQALRAETQFEAAVFALFRTESSEFYRQLLTHSAEQQGVVRGLKEDLNILKVLMLDFLDGDDAAGRKLAADLAVRIRLEEDYLIPVLRRIADQTPKSQSNL